MCAIWKTDVTEDKDVLCSGRGHEQQTDQETDSAGHRAG